MKKGVSDSWASLQVGSTIPQDREQATSSFTEDEVNPELVEFESRYKTQPHADVKQVAEYVV